MYSQHMTSTKNFFLAQVPPQKSPMQTCKQPFHTNKKGVPNFAFKFCLPMSSSRAVCRRELAHRGTNIFHKRDTRNQLRSRTRRTQEAPFIAESSIFKREIMMRLPQKRTQWKHSYSQQNSSRVAIGRPFCMQRERNIFAQINNNHPMLSTSTHVWVTRHELMSFFGFFCFTVSLIHICSFSQLLIFTPAQLQNVHILT